ncbi:hypothetical protein AB6A40_006031 [Gnathostoma spinigerum]|uniref:Autophagy-related protein 101 n=1 Tax=Gnathostoma spinigerum TaxID=75299 RepID=A0ABD6ERK9_9BILA
MNARSQTFNLTVESRQLKDAVSCLFHTILLHRSVGKFQYSTEGNYKVGSIGIEEVNCEFIDLTYVRVNSPELKRAVQAEIDAFCNDAEERLRTAEKTDGCGTLRHAESSSSLPFLAFPLQVIEARITLEFYQKRKRQWFQPEEQLIWEIWQFNFEVVKLTDNDHFERMRETVADSLSNKVLTICCAINKPQYLPKMPVRTELPNIFDNSFSDCQPYLFRVSGHSPAVGLKQSQSTAILPSLSSAKELIKNTLFF